MKKLPFLLARFCQFHPQLLPRTTGRQARSTIRGA